MSACRLKTRLLPFTKSSGSSLCFGNGYFTPKYAPVTNSGRPDSPAVFVS
ncbi:hypothetical protein GCM10022206_76480 [Streptomyces chiangmaiensis]